MRIISGKHKARKLLTPPESAETRPIPDRVKEAVFNLLRGHFEEATVLDLFAGTGSIGLECVSRGAQNVLLVERDRKMAGVLQRNIDALGEAAAAKVFTGDALGPAVVVRCPKPLKLVFMDPPYPLALGEKGWERVRAQASALGNHMRPDGFMCIRTPHPFLRRIEGEERPIDIPLDIPGLEGPETHVYRHTAVHLYAPMVPDTAD